MQCKEFKLLYAKAYAVSTDFLYAAAWSRFPITARMRSSLRVVGWIDGISVDSDRQGIFEYPVYSD